MEYFRTAQGTVLETGSRTGSGPVPLSIPARVARGKMGMTMIVLV